MAVGVAKRYIPNQHGAWAMLVIPFLIGMIAGKAVSMHVLLFGVWLLSYLFSFPLLQWIKTRRTSLYKMPMLIYGSLFVAGGTALALLSPHLLRWVPLFVVLFVVNCYYARIKKERAFLNDLTAVIMFSLMVLVSYDAGGGTDFQLAGELFVLCVLYFTGTIFYVKTIIREKHNPRYYLYSVGFHLIVLLIAAIWYPRWLLVPLAVLLIRAAWSPRTGITVKKSGILEIVYAVLFTVTVFIAYGV